MMKEILAIVAGFIGIGILAHSMNNIEEWTFIDNECYVRYYEDNRLFGEDSRSRVVYCKR